MNAMRETRWARSTPRLRRRRKEGIAMEHTRFDRLVRSIGEAPSRRRLLTAAVSAAVAGVGLHAGDAGAKQKKGRKRCHIEAGRGYCRHDVCVIPCKNPGGCSGSGESLPPCGPEGFGCGCATMLNGKSACILPAQPSQLCLHDACGSNSDCNPGSICVKVPGCCPGQPQVCVVACQPR